MTGPGSLARAHTPDSEGADDELVEELQEVTGAMLEESHDHVPSDPKFVGMLSTEEAAEATGEAGVGGRAGDGRREVGTGCRRGGGR